MTTTLHSGATILRYKGDKLLGVLNRPDGRETQKFPGVLFLHGFPGAEKNVDVQRRLLALGVASFALHFSGAWGSEGEYRFSSLVPQARAALKFLATREFVDARRLAVFGFSMGGWAALNLASRVPGLRAVAAISPVGGPEMIGPRNLEFIKRLSRPLRAPKPAALMADFRSSMRKFDPHQAVTRRTCPLLLVHGDEDVTVPALISRRLHVEARAPKKLVIAKGARHDFLDRRDWLTRLTADWLAKQLYLPA
jgi:dipeptidyl aminopeptidase/acylaminoacyl peptidase